MKYSRKHGNEHRVCNLKLLVRSARETTENEHRVCNLRLLMRNTRENMENEHRVCNLKLHNVRASNHSHHDHYYHSQYKIIQIHIWVALL